MSKTKKKPKPLRRSKASKTRRAMPSRHKLNGNGVPRQNGTKKKAVPAEGQHPEVMDLYERARWRKERREYWRNRFRRLVSNLAARSLKAKRR